MNQSRLKLINGPGHWLIATNITKLHLFYCISLLNYLKIRLGKTNKSYKHISF